MWYDPWCPKYHLQGLAEIFLMCNENKSKHLQLAMCYSLSHQVIIYMVLPVPHVHMVIEIFLMCNENKSKHLQLTMCYSLSHQVIITWYYQSNMCTW